MAADFTAWDRTTLEQFAREATAKLIENKEAIDGLLSALEGLVAYVLKQSDGGPFPIEVIPAQREIIKHESTTKEQHSA